MKGNVSEILPSAPLPHVTTPLPSLSSQTSSMTTKQHMQIPAAQPSCPSFSGPGYLTLPPSETPNSDTVPQYRLNAYYA